MCHLKHKLVFFLLLFTHLYNYMFSSYHLEISHSLLLFTHLYNYIFITLTVIIWRLTYLCFPQVRQRNPELLPQCSSQTENVQLLRNGLRWCRGEHDLIRPKFCHRRANVKLVRHRPQGHTHKSSNPTHEVSRGWLRLVRQRPRQLPKRSQRPSLQVQEAVKKPKRPLRLRQTPISPSSRYFVCLFLFVITSYVFFNYCCSVCLWESATYVIDLLFLGFSVRRSGSVVGSKHLWRRRTCTFGRTSGNADLRPLIWEPWARTGNPRGEIIINSLYVIINLLNCWKKAKTVPLLTFCIYLPSCHSLRHYVLT